MDPPRSIALAALLAVSAVAMPRPLHAQGALSALQTDVDQIARRARPAVVAVFAQRMVTYPRPLPGQASRRLHTRVGSGVAVEESGIVLRCSEGGHSGSLLGRREAVNRPPLKSSFEWSSATNQATTPPVPMASTVLPKLKISEFARL